MASSPIRGGLQGARFTAGDPVRPEDDFHGGAQLEQAASPVSPSINNPPYSLSSYDPDAKHSYVAFQLNSLYFSLVLQTKH